MIVGSKQDYHPLKELAHGVAVSACKDHNANPLSTIPIRPKGYWHCGTHVTVARLMMKAWEILPREYLRHQDFNEHRCYANTFRASLCPITILFWYNHDRISSDSTQSSVRWLAWNSRRFSCYASDIPVVLHSVLRIKTIRIRCGKFEGYGLGEGSWDEGYFLHCLNEARTSTFQALCLGRVINPR